MSHIYQLRQHAAPLVLNDKGGNITVSLTMKGGGLPLFLSVIFLSASS